MSHDAPTVSARFVYGFTTTHAGSATVHPDGAIRMLKNNHDAVTIRYGATTVQAGSATAASRSTNVHDLAVVMSPNYDIKYHYLSITHQD